MYLAICIPVQQSPLGGGVKLMLLKALLTEDLKIGLSLKRQAAGVLHLVTHVAGWLLGL